MEEDISAEFLQPQAHQEQAGGAGEPDEVVKAKVAEDPDIVHQGWIMKRGEHFKNWRQRYVKTICEYK